MRLELDDPRLMDYVLGELEDGEALTVAAALEQEENKEARELIEELRCVTEMTRRILHEEDPGVALSDEQRAAIVGTVATAENVVQGPRWWFVRRVVFSAVACAILVLGVAPLYWRTIETKRSAEIQRMAALAEDQALVDQFGKYIEIRGQSGKQTNPRVLTEPLSDEERAKMRRNMHELAQLSSADGVEMAPESLEKLSDEMQARRKELLALQTELGSSPESSTTSSMARPVTPAELERLNDEIQKAQEDVVELEIERATRAERGLESQPRNEPEKKPEPRKPATLANGLQNVEVGDSVRIRGRFDEGRFGEGAFINGGEEMAAVEQRPRLGSKADFADDVSTHIEFDSYESWGDFDAGGLGGQGAAGNLPPAAAKSKDRLSLESGLSLGGGTSPTDEQWAEYNVGNLTGQTALPEQVASNHEESLEFKIREPQNDNLWQWNTPTDKPTEIVGGPGTETYVKVAGVKPFVAVKDEPLSTFSIDVDTAAYSNVRRFLSQGQLPPADAVRIEEMINYFAYSYPQPTDGRPFAVAVHGAPAPWAPERQLVRIGVKGKEVPASERPPANLVFLLDVSGSMGDANKLPLVKESMKTLLSQLRPNDRVGIVTYAGDARLVLGSTPCSEGAAITQAIESLNSGGSTNGGGGIQMAYDLAQSNFIKEGINRVIMATDGDFNVGTTEHGDLMGMIEARAKSGVFLTTLGFGMGNLKDSTLEQLANRGNGNYAYIDNHAEARKALVDQLSGTLQTIAKDVKIQVEFNPAKVSHYRLLGYENRALANQDFNDDTKDAGEIGAGHTVTALYEIIPAGVRPMTGVDALKYQSPEPSAPVEVQPGVPSVDALKYQTGVPAPGADVVEPAKPGFGGEERFAPEPMPVPMPVPAGEWLTVKMRYKQPEGNESTKIDVPLLAMNGDLREVDADFRFASAVAAFGQVLRNSGYRHSTNFDRIIELARGAANGDADREAFVDLVITAKTLSTQNR